MIDNKISLGFFPTPLHRLKHLSEQFPEYNIYIKRDDHTGLASGGNKTRKLEFLIKQALDNNYDTIITAGAQQSNHCRQTAAACAIAGLECHLLLGGKEPENYEGNLLLSSLLGAQIHFTGDNRKGEDIEIWKHKLEAENKHCYVIPYGGSNLIGALGFVSAVKELKQQMNKNDITIDHIFFASSSGGMQAGLTLGKELHQLHAELVPISIDKEELNGQPLEEVVLKIVQEGADKLNISKSFQGSDVKLNKDYDQSGYGNTTSKEIEAITLLAQKEGILLDPVYTGRAFYGMLDHLKKKKLPIGSNVLFWHTGGLPAVFKYGNALKR